VPSRHHVSNAVGRRTSRASTGYGHGHKHLGAACRHPKSPSSRERAARTDVSVSPKITEEEGGTPLEGLKASVDDYTTAKRNHTT